MNPHVSANWLEIAFPAIMTLVVAVQFWRNRAKQSGRLYTIGSSLLVLALFAASTANLFYQNALYSRAWPLDGLFDQVIVTPTADVFVKIRDPIMSRAYRVQRYDCHGRFKSAFLPDSAGGTFKMAAEPGGRLSIYSVRTDTVDSFDFDGGFLQRRNVESPDMPFDFLENGPSIKKSGDCEFLFDPVSGEPMIKSGLSVTSLEKGDWILEYLLGRRVVFVAAVFGGGFLLISLLRERLRLQS